MWASHDGRIATVRPRCWSPRAAALLAGLAVTLLGPAAAVAQGGATASAAHANEQVDALRLPFPQDVGGLHPTSSFDVGYPLISLVYDTLLWRDAAGQPQPWLAREMQRSPDGRQVTLHLAEHARWHDGQPVTAADVAFTFAFFTERGHPRFAGQLEAVDRVATPDAHTVVLHLAHAAPGLADQPLADVPILPAHRWQGLPVDQATPDGPPVGSGPYRLADHTPGEGYRFEADGDYFRGRPRVATLQVPLITDATATLRALEEGEADLLTLPLPARLQDQLTGLGLRFLDGPVYTGTVARFNLRRAPFDDPEARRAVAQAIDLDRVAGAVGGDAVAAEHGYLHPASPWAPAETLHEFDEADARRRVDALDLPDLEVLAPDNDPVKVAAGRQVALALRRVGVEAELASRPPGAVAEAVGADGSEPTFDLAIASTPKLTSYNPAFLGPLFGTGARTPLNGSGYTRQAFTDAVAAIARTPAGEGRQAAVDRAAELLARDVPVLPLVFANNAFAYRPFVYDHWVFVKGSGPLDKRSFLPGDHGDEPDAASETPTPGTQPSAQPPPPTDDGPGLARRPVAVALAGGLVAVLAVAMATLAGRVR